MKNSILLLTLLASFFSSAQNILIEKVLYRSSNAINLISVDRSDGLVYFTSADRPGLLFADVRGNKIVIDSTVNNVECIGYTPYDPVYSLVQLPDGSFYVLNRINGELKAIANNTSARNLPNLQFDETKNLFFGVRDNNIITCKITENGVSSIDTAMSFDNVNLKGVHSFNNQIYLTLEDDNSTFIAKGGENKYQKLRYPINYGESSNGIVVLNKDSIIVSRSERLGEQHIALIYASEIVSQLDTVELKKIKEVEVTQIDSFVNQNSISSKDYTAQKQRDIGKGRWSTLISRTTDALSAMVSLNEALTANPQSFSYKEDSVYFILGPKREEKAEAEKDSIFFSKRGIVTRTYDVVYDTLVKPADVILRLKCIDRLQGSMPGFSADFYEYETNTLVKSAIAFEDEVVYLSYLPEYTLGLTITSKGYLPHSLRIDPKLEYKSTDQIEKIIFLDRFQDNNFVASGDEKTSSSSENTSSSNTKGSAPGRNYSSQSVVLQNIFFGFDSDKLSEASKREIRLVYENQKNAKSILIIGHTDSKGPSSYNQTLSEKRAFQVGEYMSSLGFEGVINTKGRGEEEPIATNETEKGRSRNRRSEIILTY